MPAPPEFCYAPGNIGMFEVLSEMEAQHPPKADGHVTVTGKIEINLHRIGCHAHPGGEGSGFRQQHPVRQKAHLVGNQHLLGQTVDKADDTGSEGATGLLSFQQLRGDVPVADDGPCNQLRKEGHIGAEEQGVSLRFDLPAVHVDHIAHALEDIERDADGQDDFRDGNPAAGQPVQAFQKETGVFEIAQNRKVQDNGRRQSGLPSAGPG